eukprot:TRINITY_DN36184_c0_g1_i2.p1 TRINITY_DN36184_c0_g1~~TRINITY_DN36184_c0_g1_i2.p1  ORF type:complete len:267 (+),score=64.98 TRINITY_DN36184_c0_g1_i2:142-942(+)
MLRSLVGSEMCIRDRVSTQSTGVFFETCGGNTDNCTLRQCAKTCDRSQVRESTATAVRILDALIRVKNALTNILFPWLNCAKLFKKIVNSGPVQACDTVIAGLTMMQNGCLIVGSALLFTTWVCFLGQKRFACPSKVAPEETMDSDAEGMEMRGVVMGVAIPTNEPTHFDSTNNRNTSYHNPNKDKMDSVTSPCSATNMATFNPLSPTSPGAEGFNNTHSNLDEQVSGAESRRGDSTVVVMGQSTTLGDTVAVSYTHLTLPTKRIV